MSDRNEITERLGKLLEKRLAKEPFSAKEVTFWRPHIRVDYMAFRPKPCGGANLPASVELGEFSCFEIKSCMADFKSGNGLNFIGDKDYLVCTDELAEQLCGSSLLHSGVSVLVPTKNWMRLRTKYDMPTFQKMRELPASCMLWAMLKSYRCWCGKSEYHLEVPE
jgi:hypothetical protein